MTRLLAVLAAGGLLALTACSAETEPPETGTGVTMVGKVACGQGVSGKVWFQMNFDPPDPHNPNFEQWVRVGPKLNFNCTADSTRTIALKQPVSHAWVLGQRYPYRLAVTYGSQPETVEETWIFDKNGTAYHGWDAAYLADPTYGIYDSYVKPLGQP